MGDLTSLDPLDAIRLAPGADVAAITTDQIRDVVLRQIDAGHWRQGDPEILVVLDADYDAPCIAWLLGDLPVQIVGRMRSDRCYAARHRPGSATRSAAVRPSTA
ncbi:transposase [Actinocrispum wychmicini]|uniref:transposase n=1 Tax=Actinocrispum wychmicini TaxID=1213861 RepID=UPI001A9E9739